MLRSIIFSSYFLFNIFLSCNEPDPGKDAVARVHDKYLYRREVLSNIPDNASSKDSISIAKDYIDQWIGKNLVLKQAENNLDKKQKDVSQQLEDYRISLLIFAYEQELIRQKLDTNVSDSEIEAYYKSNPGNFELKNNIIRLKYIKLPIKTQYPVKLKVWLQQGDNEKLEKYCRLNAVNFLLDDLNWLFLDDVLKEIPLSDYTKEKFDNNLRLLEFKDSRFQYLVSISGFKVKETNAPLSFEKYNIRNIILNKRKIKLIDEMQKNLYNDALDQKDIEKYDR